MKLIKAFATLIVILTIINLTAYSVYHVMNGGNNFGPYSKHVVDFASLPINLNTAVKTLLFDFDPYKIRTDISFSAVNQLEDDLFGLVSHFRKKENKIVFQLLNFKTDEVLHEWYYPINNSSEIEYATATHPMLMNDHSIVFGLHISDLVRLDKDSKLIWRNNEVAFHHSKEVDHEGNIWVCTSHKDAWASNLTMSNLNGQAMEFRDDRITKVNPETGGILFSKSVTEILMENGYRDLVYRSYEQDLIHLNDIQPVLSESAFWETGDLFISCRNIHTVFQYRPSTGEVVWLKSGPWVNQHDVDIIDSSTIMVFNNNLIRDLKPVFRRKTENIRSIDKGSRFNQILTYNFETDKVENVLSHITSEEKMNTQMQGRSELLRNGNIFIEETNNGKFYIADREKLIFRKHYQPVDHTYALMPGWTRVYERLPLNKD